VHGAIDYYKRAEEARGVRWCAIIQQPVGRYEDFPAEGIFEQLRAELNRDEN